MEGVEEAYTGKEVVAVVGEERGFDEERERGREEEGGEDEGEEEEEDTEEDGGRSGRGGGGGGGCEGRSSLSAVVRSIL